MHEFKKFIHKLKLKMTTKRVFLALVVSFIFIGCDSYRMRERRRETFEDDRENDEIDRLIRQLDDALDRNRPSSSIRQPEEEYSDPKPPKPSRQLPKDFVPNCRRWSLC